jgi:hypothetical protein
VRTEQGSRSVIRSRGREMSAEWDIKIGTSQACARPRDSRPWLAGEGVKRE